MRLERISEDVEIDMRSLGYLDENGFTPGADGPRDLAGPDGTLVLEVGASTVAFGSELSRRLYVAVA